MSEGLGAGSWVALQPAVGDAVLALFVSMCCTWIGTHLIEVRASCLCRTARSTGAARRVPLLTLGRVPVFQSLRVWHLSLWLLACFCVQELSPRRPGVHPAGGLGSSPGEGLSERFHSRSHHSLVAWCLVARLSHAFTDRSVCVAGGAFPMPCCRSKYTWRRVRGHQSHNESPRLHSASRRRRVLRTAVVQPLLKVLTFSFPCPCPCVSGTKHTSAASAGAAHDSLSLWGLCPTTALAERS